MYFVAIAWKKPHFWTVQVVFHPHPRQSIKNHTYLESIFPFFSFSVAQWCLRTSGTVLK